MDKINQRTIYRISLFLSCSGICCLSETDEGTRLFNNLKIDLELNGAELYKGNYANDVGVKNIKYFGQTYSTIKFV